MPSSTRGATNVIGLVAADLPFSSSSSTGRPTRRSGARSSGTSMYASSASFSSIVVMTVDAASRDRRRGRQCRRRSRPAARQRGSTAARPALFTHLRVERGEARLGGPERVLRLLEFLPADGAGANQRLEALDLLPPVPGRPPRCRPRLASVLRTVACCLSALIWTSGVPSRTRSPDFTKMRVTSPSTSGWTVVDRSDRTVAMNSDVCWMGFCSSVSSVTPAGGGAGGRACGRGRRRWPPARRRRPPPATECSSMVHVTDMMRSTTWRLA